MSFFFKKQEIIEEMLIRYLEQCDLCLESFKKALDLYFEKGPIDSFGVEVHKAHQAESTADSIRREVELTLFGKALLPESREDILNLLEAFDKLPNTADTVSFVLYCQKTKIPDSLLPNFRQLLELNLEAYRLVRKSVDEILNNSKDALYFSKQVKTKETEIDQLERQMICRIFEFDCANGIKLLLKELVLLMGSISDRAETVSDRVAIIAVKRQI